MAVSPVDVQKYLKGVSYPATKDELVDTARQEDAPDDVLDALDAIEDRSYDGPTDIAQALSSSE